MKLIGVKVLIGAAVLSLSACATVPDKSELERVSAADLKSAVVGNTVTAKKDYGRAADYVESGSNGYARAWGNWGSQSATASYEFNDGGEWCATYSGDHEWSTPEHQYCSVYYMDAEGNYYSETTVDTYKPEREGDMEKVEVKSGDAYGLAGS